QEILSTVIVRNLDTGQTMPLSVAAEQVSQCLNPLALQIMSRTKEFACAGSEDTPVTSFKKSFPDGNRKVRTRSKRFKRLLGKSARRVKEVAESQVERAVHKVKHGKPDGSNSESLNVSSDEEVSDSLANSSVKIKASSTNKGPYQFNGLKQVQDIAVHVGAVWSMKFIQHSCVPQPHGQNNVIWVWVLKDYYAYFNEMRSKYVNKERGAVFATPPRNSMEPPTHEPPKLPPDNGGSRYESSDQLDEEEEAPFRSLPFSSYVGHSADVLDLAWSKNYFTLSSSMDKTVRLWHVSQKECLCCFQHIDFVTAISFHPRDDRYFLSGSLDSKLRLWNIPEKKVALWNESSSGGALITTVNFCENGKFAVCGTYDGRCLFYDTEHLKYHTQIHVRSSRGRNTKGHKITGIEPLPSEHKILVTSNDSRVRLYDLRDLSLTCKYKGLTNMSSQIKASFSHDCKYIVCGSEDKSVYIWKTNLPQDVTKFRRDRNDCWESIRAHDAVVTCAIFAPYP
uniref:WD repeat-containing protein 44 n=1 Tax=Ciona savignyi TaxID=51511 RepID=H2ZDE7_CIOSA